MHMLTDRYDDNNDYDGYNSYENDKMTTTTTLMVMTMMMMMMRWRRRRMTMIYDYDSILDVVLCLF